MGAAQLLLLLLGGSTSSNAQPPRHPDQRLQAPVDLVISEIMYHPAPSGVEFIEVFNPGRTPLDLTGVSFVEGIELTFDPGTTIGPGSYLVLGQSEEDFAAAYPGVTPAGLYQGRLDNGGERVTISQAGITLCTVEYDDQAPWPAETDGLGYSLVLRTPAGDCADPANWGVSAALGGSPGSEDVNPDIPKVLVNEALTNTDPPLHGAVEIFNPTDKVADLGGWLLSDDPATPRKAMIPDNGQYVLAPGEFAVISQDLLSHSPGSVAGETLPGFELGADGGQGIFLFSSSGGGILSGYAHGFWLEAAQVGVSFGRHVTSNGETHFVAQQATTLGAVNAGPRVGPVLITEIYYHPQYTNGFEYLELKNISSATIDLGGDVGGDPESAWQIDGIGFTFPPGTSLAAGEELLVVNAPPAMFRAAYGVSDTLQVLGPFGTSAADGTATLSNGGETITLLRPELSSQGTSSLVVVDRVRYDDRPPWPDADGNGLALCRADEVSYGNQSTSWIAEAPCFAEQGCAQGVDPSQVLFDTSRLIEVEIDIDADDWDELRHQSRYWLDLVAGDCQSQPFPSPFTYFPASVEVDGVRVDNVGVRKKGFVGSMTADNPALKIKLDEYVDGQRLYGLRLLTLNNNLQDETFINQCLGYELMADAGLVVPRCSFARVSVNGAYLGIYTHVESIKESFFSRHYSSPNGNLYEGTLADFRPGWTGPLERKNNSSDPERGDIEAVLDALEAPDEQLVAALESVIDLDQFYVLWGMDVILANWDGYAGNANNYFVYADPDTGRFSFIPWGLDQILWEGFPYSHTIGDSGVFARGIIAYRLFQYAPTRQRYLTTVRELLDTVWFEQDILDRVDELESLLTPWVLSQRRALFHHTLESRIRAFVATRREQVLGIFDTGPPPLSDSEDPPTTRCLPEVGTITGTITTSWGSLETWDSWGSGSGTLTMRYGSETFVIPAVGLAAGVNPDQPAEAIFWFEFTLPDGSYASIWLVTTPAAVASGTIHLREPEGIGWFTLIPADQQPQFDGFVLNGELALDQSNPAYSQTLTGRFEASIYSF